MFKYFTKVISFCLDIYNPKTQQILQKQPTNNKQDQGKSIYPMQYAKQTNYWIPIATTLIIINCYIVHIPIDASTNRARGI